VNPFGFVRLLRNGRPLACLSLSSAISDVCHGAR
jgi:hypothetical protein